LEPGEDGLAPLAALALVVVLLAVAGVPAVSLLNGAGLLCMAFREGKQIVSKRTVLGGWIGLGSGSASGALGVLPIFFYFLKIGAALVGSGYVLLPVLRVDLVAKLHWLTDSQVLDAAAVSQATPGPFFTVATFIGYLLAGWKGATLGTLGMFLPAFLYVGVTSGFLPKLRKSPLAGGFLDGVNAAAVALMAFVGRQFGRAALVNVPAVILAALSVVLVFRYKVNSTWPVLGGAASGMLLRLTGGG
jgi:chromate transporter